MKDYELIFSFGADDVEPYDNSGRGDEDATVVFREHLWSGWKHEPFTSTSRRHVSFYGRRTNVRNPIHRLNAPNLRSWPGLKQGVG